MAKFFQHSYSVEQNQTATDLRAFSHSSYSTYLENWKQNAQTNCSVHIVKTRGVFRTHF